MMGRLERISTLAVVAALLALTAGCGGGGSNAAPPKGGEVGGVVWGLTSIAGSTADVKPFKITAEFAGGTVSGSSGVNTYSGPASAKPDGSFQAGPLVSTLMAGPPAAMAAEKLYLGALEKATTYRAAAGKLTLFAADGTASLVYDAAAPPKLQGSKWDVTGYNNGKQAVTSPSVGSTLWVHFGDNMRLNGSGGVNTFAGDYQVNGDKVSVGALASTKKAGPPELMTQEALYLKALQSVVTWDISGDTLTMRDAAGATQVVGRKAVGAK